MNSLLISQSLKMFRPQLLQNNKFAQKYCALPTFIYSHQKLINFVSGQKVDCNGDEIV